MLVFDGIANPIRLLTNGARNSFTLSYDPWGMVVTHLRAVPRAVAQSGEVRALPARADTSGR